MRISAAVLVGGHSRRMGRDKAALPAAPFATLLERQLALLAALAPCERLIAARVGQALPRGACDRSLRVVRDDGSSGPLGGLVSILRTARAPRVFVLAVDGACLNSGLIRRIVGAAPVASDTVGVIPRTALSPQPLAALWPRSMLPLAEAQLANRGDLSLRTLVNRGIAAGLLRWFDVPSWDDLRFANWNRPTDSAAPRCIVA